MRTNIQQQRYMSPAEEMGLGTKKTILILCTVVGCIAILFPKIFYPMMFSASLDANRGPPNMFKQERPPHIKDIVHPAMQERGRAIPPHSVPIIEKPGRPLPPPNIERRAGGIPGHPGASLRAAAYQAQQQQQQKGTHSMIMPLYTFCIVAFFVFTLVKILLKKTKKTKVEANMESDPKFTEKVFKQDAKKKIVYTAIQGIIDATNEQLSEIEKECAEKNKEHNTDKTSTEEDIITKSEIKLDDSASTEEKDNEKAKDEEEEVKKNKLSEDLLFENQEAESKNSIVKTEHDIEIEKRLNNLKEAMHIKSVENDENSDLKSIYLEGELPLDPKIFVSATETETKTEKLSHYPSVKDVVDEDETVILSGKMTISLISLANNEEEKNGIVEDHTTTNNVA
ncbi:hypothetical protein PVAND_011830 [Polypedilum vanderplanki]|uniref:Resistance to inhibitors of cholinesterase protein 3 N-terminal domain-containing protein n=1 Tax=Polypedilum vanderplanki TaxID=319348 RepID=A0A9J6CKU3_POLVA|nr:hypothetical protein PVAND_011830 [Polypedilum vanderplanki]